MPSIWRKETLEKLLRKGESAWDFESKGSLRAYDNNNFFQLIKTLSIIKIQLSKVNGKII